MTQTLWSQDAYIQACKFAAEAHRGQLVPGADLPYLMHVSLVGMEVIAALSTQPDRDGNLAVQCALLHDVIEDTAVTYQSVAGAFGRAVADGVLALSKVKTLPRHEQMADSLRRIRQQPAEIWMVKLADRITNLQPPPHYWTKDKIRRYQAEAVEILNALGEASQLLAARLREKIDAYTPYARG